MLVGEAPIAAQPLALARRELQHPRRKGTLRPRPYYYTTTCCLDRLFCKGCRIRSIGAVISKIGKAFQMAISFTYWGIVILALLFVFSWWIPIIRVRQLRIGDETKRAEIEDTYRNTVGGFWAEPPLLSRLCGRCRKIAKRLNSIASRLLTSSSAKLPSSSAKVKIIPLAEPPASTGWGAR